MGVIRRIHKILIGLNSVDNTVSSLGGSGEVHRLSDQDDSLESVYFEETHSHHCGCFAEPGGRCSECGVISCVRCHRHCGGSDNQTRFGCGKPLCREHSPLCDARGRDKYPILQGLLRQATQKAASDPSNQIASEATRSRGCPKMTNENSFGDIERKVQIGLELDVFKDSLGRRLLQLLPERDTGSMECRPDCESRRKCTAKRNCKKHSFQITAIEFGGTDSWLRYESATQSSPMCSISMRGAFSLRTPARGRQRWCASTRPRSPHQVQGMWLVDLRKREFRALRPEFARRGIDLIVVRSREFRINPLQVPHSTGSP